ncbi:MAG: proline iminopeptidase-family hydrolase [Bacteroidales bacterium]|nr:proline iminopeptidase-family hydrolase [Bacteroidales bacterium]
MKRSPILIVMLLLITATVICQDYPEEEGYVKVKGGRIWYKKIGREEGVPLLLIHGGPGGSICGMIPYFSKLAGERPVIFYDQLGSGCSDRPEDSTLWNLPRFVDEIDSLRKALNLGELHILGSSWGASILVEYMASRNPKGVCSIIFSGPLISTPVWMQDSRILISRMPQYLQDTLLKYESLGDYQASAYLAAADSFYSRYMNRGNGPYPDFPDCDKCSGFNDDIYNYMWGPTEFTVTGPLINFDRSAFLPEITQPILYMAGRYDEARPESVMNFKELSRNAEMVIIEDAGHATVYDQPEAVLKAVHDFLLKVESKSTCPE